MTEQSVQTEEEARAASSPPDERNRDVYHTPGFKKLVATRGGQCSQTIWGANVVVSQLRNQCATKLTYFD